MMLHRFNPHFDSSQRAVIHIGTHPVQYARELFGTLQERVDGDDHVGEQLSLRRGDALHDLEDCLPVVACQTHRVDMTAELVGLWCRQRAARTVERFMGVRGCGAIEHVAPGISILPQFHVLREQPEAAPDGCWEQRYPAESVAHNQVDKHQAAADGRPRDEIVAELGDHAGFTAGREIALGVPLGTWPRRAPPLWPATARRPGGWPAEAGFRSREQANARTARRTVRRRTA